MSQDRGLLCDYCPPIIQQHGLDHTSYYQGWYYHGVGLVTGLVYYLRRC